MNNIQVNSASKASTVLTATMNCSARTPDHVKRLAVPARKIKMQLFKEDNRQCPLYTPRKTSSQQSS